MDSDKIPEDGASTYILHLSGAPQHLAAERGVGAKKDDSQKERGSLPAYSFSGQDDMYGHGEVSLHNYL